MIITVTLKPHHWRIASTDLNTLHWKITLSSISQPLSSPRKKIRSRQIKKKTQNSPRSKVFPSLPFSNSWIQNKKRKRERENRVLNGGARKGNYNRDENNEKTLIRGRNNKNVRGEGVTEKAALLPCDMPPSLFCFWFLKLLCWILNVSLSHTLTCFLFVFIIWTNKLCLYFLVSASISFLF